MKTKKIIYTICSLLVFGVLGSCFIWNEFVGALPNKSDALSLYLFILMSVSSGPFAAPITLSPYVNDVIAIVTVASGLSASISWVVFFRKDEMSHHLMLLPVTVWIAIGIFCTFFGVANGIT